MQPIIGKAFFLLILFSFGSLSGANLDLTKDSDFLNPSLTTISSTNNIQRQIKYLFIRAQPGFEENYQYRNEFANVSSIYLRLDSDLYYKHHQFSFDVIGRTSLMSNDELRNETVPSLRGEISYSLYLPRIGRKYGQGNHTADVQAKESRPLPKPIRNVVLTPRFSMGVSLEEREHNKVLTEVRVSLENEYFLQWAKRNPGFLKSSLERAVGGYEYAFRTETDSHHIGFDIQYLLHLYPNGSSLYYGFGVSANSINDDWHWGIWNNNLQAVIHNPWNLSSLNIAYGLNRDLWQGEWHHQGVIYLSFPLISEFL